MAQIDFTVSTPDEFANSLAQYLPNGNLYVAKTIAGTRFRNLLLGMSQEGIRVESLVQEFSNDYYIPNSVLLLEKWEDALGIPDSCFAGKFTVAETPEEQLIFRQRDAVVKFALMNGSTKEDLIAIALLYGFEITITNYFAFAGFPVMFPWMFGGDGSESRFTMVVTFLNVAPAVTLFPAAFPWVFGDPGNNIVQCIINKMVPASVNVIYRYAG